MALVSVAGDLKAAEEAVPVNPHQYNTAADYDRWKLTKDSNGRELGVWSESGAESRSADQPFQEIGAKKRSIPINAIAALILVAAGVCSRLRC